MGQHSTPKTLKRTTSSSLRALPLGPTRASKEPAANNKTPSGPSPTHVKTYSKKVCTARTLKACGRRVPYMYMCDTSCTSIPWYVPRTNVSSVNTTIISTRQEAGGTLFLLMGLLVCKDTLGRHLSLPAEDDSFPSLSLPYLPTWLLS